MNNSSSNVWAITSARQDSKQHCNKIAQGLEKFDNKSASRAIWELVQNARDVAAVNPETGKKECRIKISLTPDEFIFAHRGKPFCFDSLTSLLKQVSSEEKESDDTVGQYGTGFLTTHSFGRRVLIDGSMDINDIDEGKFVDIDNFEMDRTFDSVPEFIEKMTTQITGAFKLADMPHVASARQWTRLRYQLDSADRALDKAGEAISAAVQLFPYVMTINDSIVSVEIDNQITGMRMSFAQKSAPQEAGLNVKEITIVSEGRTEAKKIYYLLSSDGQDMAIMPLASATQAKSLDGVAKLFVHFPLLGTENFGMDFIFHSQRFFPVEARDGIHLPVDNPNVEKKYKANVAVFKEMSQMVFDYLDQHTSEIDGLADVCRLSFCTEGNDDPLTDEFFAEIKKIWSDSYFGYPMVPTAEGKKSVRSGEVKVFDTAISATVEASDGDVLSVVYPYALQVSMMPVKDEVMRWSSNVRTWCEDDTAYSVTLENIASRVSNDGNLNNLHAFLHFIKDAGQEHLFRSYALIPNRENQLRKAGDLRDAAEIPTMLYAVAQKLVPAITVSFVKESFADVYDLTDHTRKDLRLAVNNSLSEADKVFLQLGKPYDTARSEALIELCSIFPKLPNESLCCKTIAILAQFYGKIVTLCELPKITDEEVAFYETPFRKLLESTLLSISCKRKEWLEENRDWLLNFLSTICGDGVYANPQHGLRDKYAIFPNRDGELCLGKELQRYDEDDEHLLDLAKRGLGKDIRKDIVAQDFADFYDFDQLTSANIGRQIEEALDEKILDSSVLVDIIDGIDHGIWSSDIFKYIADNKEKLFFEQKQGKSRESLYKLMKADDETLETLAELSEETDLTAIIEEAKAAIAAQKAEEARFDFNHSIGKEIENTLRQRISEALADHLEVRANDDQYGQDIVILSNEEPVYFIEVKAKWNFYDAAHMSRTQMQKAVSNPTRYALCCVDLTDYSANDEYPEPAEAIARTYVHIDIADKLQGIMSGIISADHADAEQTISMGGDYRCNIPKKVFTSGTPFSSLIEAIVANL